MKSIKDKKALSSIISTILLILLSVAAVVILAKAIIPFVKEKLAHTQCFDTLNQFSIDAENGYACYYMDGSQQKINITIHSNLENIYGFRLVVYGAGTSESFDITESDGLPAKGTEKTYNIDIDATINNPTKAAIVPMLSESELCEQKDEISLIECE